MNTTPTIAAMADVLLGEGANPANVYTLSGMILDRLNYSDSGIPTVMTPDGKPAVDSVGVPVTVQAMLDGLRRDLPDYWTKTPAATSTSSTPPANETVTAKALREARERKARNEAAKTAPPAELNPWASGSTSVTRQIMIERRDPAAAARLKAAAAR